MDKIYDLVINFKDGTSWDKEEIDMSQNPEGIKVFLEELEKMGNAELTAQESGETREVSEIKSVEILF
ncbi:hypothetical protein QT711_11320 [Sporosarcina saromensis]|uniref:Uncharacterized protein n=1 Tax=Sporosarcina saromensis TaxID=359365 RepID=A0ABU4G9Z7_9BACL|nr:hypothetical protein [Sporosarcina saromensis]MDW0113778.1 hypothetical protein [Sporosarcina saromensis]